MPSCATLTSESRFMALFVGQKHSGKTVAACSFMPQNPSKRIKVHDGDGRIRGILAAPWIDKSRIDYEYFPPRSPGAKPFFQRLNDDLEGMVSLASINQLPYDTLIEDSLTAMTNSFVLDAIPLTHAKGGKKIGVLNMAGPEDYGFEATSTQQVLACLRSLPIQNIIVTAHIIDRYGKADPENPFSESVVVGEKLAVRDKIGVNTGIFFDHIFKFSRKVFGLKEHFYVEFISDIACTSYPGLKPGLHEITGRNFRDFLLEEVAKGQQTDSPANNEIPAVRLQNLHGGVQNKG